MSGYNALYQVCSYKSTFDVMLLSRNGLVFRRIHSRQYFPHTQWRWACHGTRLSGWISSNHSWLHAGADRWYLWVSAIFIRFCSTFCYLRSCFSLIECLTSIHLPSHGFDKCRIVYQRNQGYSELADVIDLSHKSHNASDKYPSMYFATEMWIHVHISVTKWCMVEVVQ